MDHTPVFKNGDIVRVMQTPARLADGTANQRDVITYVRGEHARIAFWNGTASVVETSSLMKLEG